MRSVYLITYNQANLENFQTSDCFARTVVEAFNETRSGLADIVQWVCSQEQHSSGGMHYQMAVKLFTPIIIAPGDTQKKEIPSMFSL